MAAIHSKLFVAVPALFAVLAFTTPDEAAASPITPGTDNFTTTDGFVDLVILGLGLVVDLISDPIPGEGGADTIVERLTTPSDGDTGTIDIELVALSLRSVAPVELDSGSGSFFDVFVDLDPSQQSLGEMNIISHDDISGGGTFDSFFDAFLRLTFVETVTSSSFVQLFQQLINPSPVTSDWIHTSGDDFLPVGDSHPLSLVTSIPLPAALPLYGTGLALMGVLGWYRKRGAAA